MKLSRQSLRLLARHTKTYRNLGLDVRSVSPADGWHCLYDVEIAGRHFSLWSRLSAPASSAGVYVITIDGRVRFVDRSNILAPAIAAWEAITGIRYLRRYKGGSPVYGCRLPVKIIPPPASEAGAFPYNYSSPILHTEDLPSLSFERDHDYFRVTD